MTMTQRTIWRRGAIVGALLAVVLAGAPAATAASPTAEGPRTYTGTIDGAEYRVEVPHRWNGTLVLYSHPYYTPEVPPGIGFAVRPETHEWLLDHGYALAASDFKGRFGFAVEPALRDQVALLDWFGSHVGRPRRTVATGSSMGAAIALLLAERNPRRFDGVAAMCGPLDLNGQWNVSLDVTFALKTLLAPGQDIELVRVGDPARSVQALQQAVARALTTPQGRARLALASSFGNVPGWYSALNPQPTDLTEQIRQQAAATQDIYVGVFGPSGRVDLERRAGGNPSWNVGIDYRHQLARSSQRDLVRQAYRTAGLDLDGDLSQLAAAPRIAPDPGALRYLNRYGVPRGSTPAPVVTLHNVADVAVADHERWYAGQVRRSGDPDQVRQLYVNRATHCAFNAAEEIVTLRTLLSRIENGAWPGTSPWRLNAAAGRLGDGYQLVFDFPTFQEASRPPAFTSFTPSPFLRPSR